MFTQVAVKKKSFCGSINSDKPCLHIDFGKFSEANVRVIKALIGSRYLTLNNTIHQWRIPKGKRLVRNRIHGSILNGYLITIVQEKYPDEQQKNLDCGRAWALRCTTNGQSHRWIPLPQHTA